MLTDGRVYLHVAAESSTATPGIQPSRQHLFFFQAHHFVTQPTLSLSLFLLSQERTQCTKSPRITTQSGIPLPEKGACCGAAGLAGSRLSRTCSYQDDGYVAVLEGSVGRNPALTVANKSELIDGQS